MRPVMQTKFGMEGNCLAACVASIFEISIDEFPELVEGPDWYTQFTNFMVERFGVQPVDLHHGEGYIDNAPRGYYIANGPAARGLEHSVVGYGNRLIHDPHPDGGFLNRVRSRTFFIWLDLNT